MKEKNKTFEEVLDSYLSRRQFLKGSAAVGISIAINGCDSKNAFTAAPQIPKSLPFEELELDLTKDIAVAKGYDHQVLIRWGDPIFADAPEFDPFNQTAQKQVQQFGFNNDFIGFVPFDDSSSERGLLVVNHEYTNPKMMFPGSPAANKLDKALTDIDIAAHGMSVLEIEKTPSGWQVKKESSYNRRITPNTPMEMSGPAAGHKRLQSIISKDGVHTLGTYGNCAGGVTPWGTILTGEENVDRYFSGNPEDTAEAENYQRFSMKTNTKSWGHHYPRWHLQKNPQEALHVGWVVEIDPFTPSAKPLKRTALGRCKHEGCNVYINADQQVVAYTGDDQRFEYVYKFVSKLKYKENDREHNLKLLENGTLYVAQFLDSGELHWLPLEYGNGPLTEENGFYSQGDVSLDTRKAADLVGATPMDRPEDIEVNPVNGRTYVMLTNNSKRKPNQINAANPRAHNSHGQVIEFWPESGNHTENHFKWDLFLLAGKPGKTTTQYHPAISENGWLSCPDNCAFDKLGNLWIATDGAERSGIADGLWATEVSGEHKALTRHFLHTPRGAELCGPFFTPSNEHLFVSV